VKPEHPSDALNRAQRRALARQIAQGRAEDSSGSPHPRVPFDAAAAWLAAHRAYSAPQLMREGE